LTIRSNCASAQSRGILVIRPTIPGIDFPLPSI
jgi:hypothetical protein